MQDLGGHKTNYYKVEHQRNKYIGRERQYVSEYLSNTKQAWTTRLEKEFAEIFGVKYAIACNSGTSALHSCLASIGVKGGDEVISPALTVIMDTFATLYVGATPVYADINKETFNIDPIDVEKKITSKTKAIIVVHLYGLPADMDAIMEIAYKHNVVVIEDSCECVLGIYKDRLAGTIGDFGCFSFERSKHLPIGEGGIVITNNEDYARRVRKFAGIGYKNLQAEEGRMQTTPSTFQDPDYKRHDTLGYNYRMPELCACVGLAQVERINEIVSQRQAVAQLYNEAIDGCGWMIPQTTPEGYVNSYWTYALRYEGKVSWREFYDAYIKNGGDGFYSAWSLPYREPLKLGLYGKCPTAEYLQPRLMQFKTNYRSLELAKRKAKALKKTIKECS